jgi:hypothetical protein
MEGRYKAFLKQTYMGKTNKAWNSRYLINLPKEVMEDMEWKVNDNLQIDIIKSGMHRSIIIIKEEE